MPLYLRLSVTDRCNLRCRYCRPQDDAVAAPRAAAGDNELLDLVCLIDAEFPIHKLRITGGEPLLHGDLAQLVVRLHAAIPRATLALTTNALLLAQQASELRRAGIDSVNISIDSANPATYRELTRGGNLDAALEGLRAARKAGLEVRLNAVLMRSVNGSQLDDLVRLAADHDCELRFIELMPFGEAAALHGAEYLSGDEALARLQRSFTYLGSADSSATAARHRFEVEGREQIVGLITAVSHPFCERCNRARLDSFGRLYNCLRTPQGVDLMDEYRAGRIDAVRERIRREVHNKTVPASTWPDRSLAHIGG